MKDKPMLAAPLYLSAAVVVFFPALELVLTVWPLSPTVLSWRYGAVGLLSRSLMTPMVGLALLFATAAFMEHRAILRWLAGLTFAGALTLLLVLGNFILDIVNFRGLVRPEATVAFDASSIVAVLKLVAVSTVLGAFGVASLAVARRIGAARERAPRTTLVAAVAKPSPPGSSP